MEKVFVVKKSYKEEWDIEPSFEILSVHKTKEGACKAVAKAKKEYLEEHGLSEEEHENYDIGCNEPERFSIYLEEEIDIYFSVSASEFDVED